MRQTAVVVVPNDDVYERDKGKTFVIKEMPAMQAEKWAWRLLTMLARSGADINMVRGTGMAGLALAGIQAIPNLNFEAAEPLMDEMVPYIRYCSPQVSAGWDNGRALNYTSKDGDGDDVEEISTWLLLRQQFVEVHTRFFTKGGPSTSTLETTEKPPGS